MKVCIFGGSFDPVHDGHIEMVNILCEHFDRVVIVPAAVSPFKSSVSASGEKRLEMLKIAYDSNSKVFISDYEIIKDGVSYTYETVQNASVLLSEVGICGVSCECYLCVGGDSFNELLTWSHPEILLKTKIALISRVGVDNSSSVKEWTERGGKVEILGSVREVSSSEIRLKIALKSFLENKDFAKICAKYDLEEEHLKEELIEKSRDLLEISIPSKVDEFIKKNGLYKDFTDILQRFDEFGLKPKRYNHIFGCAITALKIFENLNALQVLKSKKMSEHIVEARDVGVSKTTQPHNVVQHDASRLGFGKEQVIRAALLHDIAKYFSVEEAQMLGVRVYEQARGASRSVQHAYLGGDIVRDCFGVDEQIENAVRYHTTGRDGMSELEAIIAFADYVEPERDFDGVENLRELAKVDFDSAMLKMYELTVRHLLTKGVTIDGNTLGALEFYRNKIAKRITNL